MMIKSSSHLIFVLLYKSTYLWSESEKRKKIWGVFDYFTVILGLWNIESFQQLNPAFCLGRGGWGCGWVLDPNHTTPSQLENMQHIFTAYSSSSINEGIFQSKKVGANSTQNYGCSAAIHELEEKKQFGPFIVKCNIYHMDKPYTIQKREQKVLQ